MDEQSRAKQIARVIQEALLRAPEPALITPPTPEHLASEQDSSRLPRFTVTRESGCLSCDPGACWVCGYLFTGERITIRHVSKGERVISDRTLHLLSHGVVRYKTQYVVRGEPVIVDLDLDELAGYLDL
jgi:hypothetical protein